ncbi:MAG TPA: ATP-binding protein [Thermoanaerobaculia bacterium]|nr:ATP-binding protein [Thermoanaerobaculia bacterium]
MDPKGDLSNLLLTFPELRPADFAPWVDPDAPARAGVTLDAFAAQEAETWRVGLAGWDQTGGRIARLRAAADFAIYTPGSEAGLQVSILSSLDAPPPEVIADGDALRERIGTVVSSLLSLLDIESDPIQGREHILLASIFDAAWRAGRGLDLAALIQQIQKPPVERVGVMDLETFYPAKERFGLSLALNNLLGSPGFAAWLRGEPLDVDRLLYSPSGKPRVAIFSIAHLSDKERMFFAALLFNQTLGWMRSKPGTTSLRALLCMDEVFGYMPPVAEPPSKRPLLTLLKQARAFGLGLVLATQNPVDLDYKGLANVGTWFLGRLQTERDKQRLMDGLEGAAGAGFDRAKTEQILSGLASRAFLLHNVHEDQPVLFQTRWTLSYLRGPLTRPEIKRLMDPVKSGDPAVAVPKETAATAPPAGEAVAPVLPPDVSQRFLPVRRKPERIVYVPRLFAAATVHYQDSKLGVEHAEEISLLAPLTDDGVDWYAAETRELGQDDLESEPVAGARFAPLPDAAVKAKSYDAWRKALEDCLYRTRKCELLRSATLGEVSKPGESERDFRIRLTETAREARDEQVAALRKKYGAQIAQLQERIRRAGQEREKQQEQASQQTLSTVVSAGAAVLGMFFGRRRSPFTAAATAARGVGRTFQERQDVGRVDETIGALQQQLADLNAELEKEVGTLQERFDPAAGELETVSLKPRKTDVETRMLMLAWEAG